MRFSSCLSCYTIKIKYQVDEILELLELLVPDLRVVEAVLVRHALEILVEGLGDVPRRSRVRDQVEGLLGPGLQIR